MDDLLVLIPARGGSKTVAHKPLQLVDGVPLVVRAARVAAEAFPDSPVVVSTDDPAVAGACQLRGIRVLPRPAELAADGVPLDAVLRHLFDQMPEVQAILCLQPTVPHVTAEDLRAVHTAYRHLSENHPQLEIYGATHSDAHYWRSNRRLTEHRNRQQMNDRLERETGIRLVTRVRDNPAQTTITLPSAGLDVDTYADLAQADLAVGRRRILLHCLASTALGSGHLHRCLRLADALRRRHDVWIHTPEPREAWVDAVAERHGFKIAQPTLDQPPHLVVFDNLDYALHTLPMARALDARVVCFETAHPDILREADLVINELLPAGLSGPRYSVLRPEFSALPRRRLRDTVRRVLVTFGGSDPAHLAQRIANLPVLQDLEVRVVQGPAADAPKLPEHATLVADAVMAEELWYADLVVTSQGRTQYEAAACGTPGLTVAANLREATHLQTPGLLHAGWHGQVTDVQLEQTLGHLLADPAVRAELSAAGQAAVDDRGVDRILWRIEGLLHGWT